MFTKHIRRVLFRPDMEVLANLGCNCLSHFVEGESVVPLVELGVWHR